MDEIYIAANCTCAKNGERTSKYLAQSSLPTAKQRRHTLHTKKVGGIHVCIPKKKWKAYIPKKKGMIRGGQNSQMMNVAENEA